MTATWPVTKPMTGYYTSAACWTSPMLQASVPAAWSEYVGPGESFGSLLASCLAETTLKNASHIQLGLAVVCLPCCSVLSFFASLHGCNLTSEWLSFSFWHVVQRAVCLRRQLVAGKGLLVASFAKQLLCGPFTVSFIQICSVVSPRSGWVSYHIRGGPLPAGVWMWCWKINLYSKKKEHCNLFRNKVNKTLEQARKYLFFL